MEFERKGLRGRIWPRLLGLAVMAGLMAWAASTPSIKEWLSGAVVRLEQTGWWGYAGFFCLYVLSAVLMVPGTILGLAAGYVYGAWKGILLVSPSSVVGAMAAFLVGRFVLRERLRAGFDERAAAVDAAVGRRGFLVVLLMRLSPVFPYNLTNYLLGATSVGPGAYLAASFLGMLPGTVLIVSAAAALEALPESSIMSRPLLYMGLAATAVLVLVSVRLARRALKPYLNR